MKTKLRITLAAALMFGGLLLAAPGLLTAWLGLWVINGQPDKTTGKTPSADGAD